MKFQPNGSRVLVLPDKAEELTQNGVIIPGAAQIEKPTGEVVAVGPEVKAEKTFKTGDKVLFIRYTGSEVVDEGVTYLLFDAEDLLGTFLS